VGGPFDKEAWERIFAPLRHLRDESGPVTLSEEYLELVRRVEELAENQAGADKSWVESSLLDYLEHYSRAKPRRS
jgi:hypothetical protein